jgi:putative ABC transport system permease protein
MLTTLAAASAFTDPSVFTDTTSSAPISVIRVRVAGVTGPDRVSLARIQQVATLIHQRTGLDVDITAGSSPTPITVQLPPDRHGRPSLTVTEDWVDKGVAVKVLSAVDRKSLVLFTLVFAVCALFVANAAAAFTRARRGELGVLACLGWDARRLFTAVLTELIAIGALGGVLGVAAGWAIAGASGVTPSLLLAALAIPASVLLSLLAGLPPAFRSARTNPLQAVRPPVYPVRRAHHARGLTALAAGNLARVPGRTAAAAIALAVGVAAFTLLLTITTMFHGAVVGSLLGNAIAVQIRGVDYIAVCVIVVLGAATVADVLYIGMRERGGELATLAATGWRETTVSRLIGTEGILLGIAGGLLGAATGAMLGVSLGAATGQTLPIAAAGLTAGIITATVASLIPASLVRQFPTTMLLAEE